MQDAFLEYAQCMRDNGYDMPDPTSAGRAACIRMEGTSPRTRRSRQAQEACEDKMPGRPGEEDE